MGWLWHRARQEVRRIFGVDPAFDGVAAPLVLEIGLGKHVVGVGESGIRIAIAHFEPADQIIGAAAMHGGRTGLQRRLGVGDHGQGVVIDLDAFGRVLGQISGLGDHHGDAARHGL